MRFADYDGIGAIAFWEWDFQKARVDPSSALPGLLGYSNKADLGPRFLTELVHPEDFPALLGKMEAFEAGALSPIQSQHRMRHGDGSWKWVVLRGEITDRDAQNRPLVSRGFLMDAGANVRLLESLLYEKDSLAATLSAMRDALFATDAVGTVTMMNEAAVALLGTDDDIGPLGASIYEVLPLSRRADQSPVIGYVERAVAEGVQLEFTHSLLLRLPNRAQLEVSVAVSPLQLEEGARSGAVVVVEDVTDKRRHEEELRQVQKLDSLARLARGISHDLNDALAALLGEVSLFRAGLHEGAGCSDELANIESAAESIKKISRQLNLFGTSTPPFLDGNSMEELVRDAAEYALRGSAIAVSYTIETPTWDVSVDQEQFGQLIQNVVMNSRDAMEDTGTLHLEVRNGGPVSFDASGGSHSVVLSIADEGPGIPDENLGHIFDPYFTTKDRGGGLGLTIAKSIATAHGGNLSVLSEVGFGTTVRITLPAVAGRGKAEVPQGSGEPPRNKRILILEHDELISGVLGRMIRLLGSKPTGIAEGEAAVERAREAMEAGNPFDLLITDTAIRGTMSGIDVLRQIHSFQPQLPAVLTTPYASVFTNRPEFHGEEVTFLPKPFTVDDLRELLSWVFTTA